MALKLVTMGDEKADIPPLTEYPPIAQNGHNGKKGTGNIRHTAWAFIAYPDDVNLVTDWIVQLERLFVKCAISPLHDKDIAEDGHTKKAHYHVLVHFPRSVTESYALKAVMPIGIRHVEHVYEESAYYAYLTHENAPDKYQYDKGEIKALCGYKPPSDVSEDAQDNSLGQLYRLIDEHHITEMAELNNFLYAEDEYLELRQVLRKNSYYVACHLNSCRHSRNQMQAQAPLPPKSVEEYEKTIARLQHEKDALFEENAKLHAELAEYRRKFDGFKQIDFDWDSI